MARAELDSAILNPEGEQFQSLHDWLSEAGGQGPPVAGPGPGTRPPGRRTFKEDGDGSDPRVAGHPRTGRSILHDQP